MKRKSTGTEQKKPVEWAKIHRRLEDLRAQVERGSLPQPQERKRILEARAILLAHPPEAPQAAVQRIEVIEFSLAYENYGIESSFVREVFPLTDLTPLPCTPSFVLGIINVRGEIVSVVDLKKFFDLPHEGLTDLNRVIILQSNGMVFGVLADLVVGARTIPIVEIQSSLQLLSGIREQYFKGVTADRTVILDAEKLLSDKKMIVHETVEA